MINQALSSGRIIHTFIIHKKKYKIGELTIGWLLTLYNDPDMFVSEYFREFSEKFPKINQEYSDMIFSVLLQDIQSREKKIRKKEETSVNDLYISIAMLVKHMGLGYADIMQLPVRVFYILLDSSPVISWEKTLEDHKKDLSGGMDSPDKIKKTLRDIENT